MFVLVDCLRYPVIGTYRSLLGVVLRNERILRDKRNLINMSLLLLCFDHSLCINRCFALCCHYHWYRLIIILLVHNKVLRFETHCNAYELTKRYYLFILITFSLQVKHFCVRTFNKIFYEKSNDRQKNSKKVVRYIKKWK